jgi:integrase
MASVNFLYRSTKDESFVTARLLFRTNHDSDPKDYVIAAKTPISITKEKWDLFQNKIRDAHLREEQLAFMNRLNELESFILDQFQRSSQNEVDKAWLQSVIKRYTNPKQQSKIPINLVDFIEYYIENRSHTLSMPSIRKFRVIKHKLMRFEDMLGRRILVGEINEDFLKEMVEYYEANSYSRNTMQRELGLIKTFCRYANRKGLQVHREMEGLKIEKEKIKSIHLTPEEIESISQLELNLDYLVNARDWLVISCYSGQRVSDFMRFTASMIREEKGKRLLEFTQQKTKKLMTIPVHPKVQEILEKRAGEFPRRISDQRYNEYIKEVCRLAGLVEIVEGKKQVAIDAKRTRNSVRRVAGKYPKYELVTSHIGRRSFATNFYGKIPTSYLIYVTGHSSEAMFLDYIGKSNKDLAIELTKYF